MSNIRDIIRTEEEAAAIIKEGQRQAEEIKLKGKEEAAAILKDADVRRETELKEELAGLVRAEEEAALKDKDELAALLAEREKVFQAKKDELQRNVLEEILES